MKQDQIFQNKRVLVVGLARSGVSVALLLTKLGAYVTVNDMKPLEENPEAQELVEAGVRVITGSHPVGLLEEDFAFVVKNPGIPYSNVMIQKALELGLKVYTEIEIAYPLLEGTLLGITASNGKTTTTTLTSLMLQESFKDKKVVACGNIGIPLTSLVEESSADDFYVTELSSFQLMGIETFKPHIAAILNIFSAHLDYHGTREEYVNAKLQITKNQTESDYLVYNADFPELIDRIKPISKAQLVPFSRKHTIEVGSYADEQAIYYNGEQVIALESIKVPGVQNIENVLAAVTMAKLAGATNEGIRRAVEQFHGVKHRTQFVREVNGRKFYNDSKATNIVATQTALNSFKDTPVVLIAGGLDRGNHFDDLLPYLSNVHTMVVYGQTKDKLAQETAHLPITVIKVDTLQEATQLAYQHSHVGDIVLLSPACASWDQYPNFEIRGDEFIRVVESF